MCTVSVVSPQANLPLSDINRQDNKTLRAQFRIIFSNQRLISCQFAFTLPRMWRFYHQAVRAAGLERQELSFYTLTGCIKWSPLIQILPKWWNIFSEVTSRHPPPPPPSLKRLAVEEVTQSEGSSRGARFVSRLFKLHRRRITGFLLLIPSGRISYRSCTRDCLCFYLFYLFISQSFPSLCRCACGVQPCGF